MENDILSAAWPEWKIVRCINRGSFGVVYEAVRTDHGVESKAAIKLIPIPRDESEMVSLYAAGLTAEASRTYFQQVVNDFVNEIQLMETFKGSQNIVSVEDYKVVEKTDRIGWNIYIRMELLTPLNDYIRDKTLTEPEVIKLGCDICSALERCAQRNVIHRDIKPDNIFINDFGDFKLGDFGIARKLENVTGGLSQKGTYNYMAPEVEKGLRYDATVDIYSLGLVLYWLLNNRRLPFLNPEGKMIGPQDVAHANRRRLDGEPLPAPNYASQGMAEVILTACNPDPGRRFPSAREMKKALLRVAKEEYNTEYTISGNAMSFQNRTQHMGPGETVSLYGLQRGTVSYGTDAIEEESRSRRQRRLTVVLILLLFILGGSLAAGGIMAQKTSDGNKKEEASDTIVTEADNEYRDEEPAAAAEENTDAGKEDIEPMEDQETEPDGNDSVAATDIEGDSVIYEPGIKWSDPVLEERIRSITGNSDPEFSIKDAEQITELDLSANENTSDSGKISDIGALEYFTNLKSLNLEGNNIENISALSGLTGLRSLSIRGNKVGDLSALSGLYNLETLDFSDNHVSDINAVGSLTGLQELRFGGNNVTDISALSSLKNLSVLRFSDNHVENLTPLINMPHLTALRFSDNNVTDISVLSNLTELTELWFYTNKVEDVSALSNLTKLEYLYMGGNNVKDISALLNLHNLKELDLNGNNVKQAQIDQIKAAVPDCDVKW